MKFLTVFAILAAMSAPSALAKQVPTQAAGKHCELGGNKIGKVAPTSTQTKKPDSAVRANS